MRVRWRAIPAITAVNEKTVAGKLPFCDGRLSVPRLVAARKARTAKAGVWKVDSTTTGFVPTKDALGIDGALAYPKFYRRVEKWKTAKPNARAFINGLKQQDDGKKLVQGAQPSPVRLWQLFEVASTRKVAVPYDVTRLWFSE